MPGEDFGQGGRIRGAGGEWGRSSLAARSQTTRSGSLQAGVGWYGTHPLGYDNAYAVKSPKRNKFAGRRLAYDHKRRQARDKGVPDEFTSADQLLKGFFGEAGRVLAAEDSLDASKDSGRGNGMKKVFIGITTQEAIRNRVLAIARGERKPAAGERESGSPPCAR